MIDNLDKLNIIKQKIDSISEIINNLSNGILIYEWNEEKGIDYRQSELSEYILVKKFLLEMLDQFK